MTGYGRWLFALLAFITSQFPSVAQSQRAIKPSDLAGTWEEVTWKNLKTGTVDSVAAHRVGWVQFTSSRWMAIQMETGRKSVSAAELASMSMQDQVKTNYAKVWDDKNAQVFAARGGTYKLAGNVLQTTRTLALQPGSVGLNETLTVVRFDGDTITLRTAPNGEGTAFELTLRRLE